ncbi:PHB depolymerase family esterase [Sphingomonas cynarae]|uniref:PHB depolymerase family esterase n=1 Tax=Sphingomonas cynarae TaxID=930197 RepID=A0ABP7E123_9SPHN
MRRLSDTINRLSTMRDAMSRFQPDDGAGRLDALDGFGSNPGGLRGWVHVPHRLAAKPALVVVLHGCTQTAAGYDRGSGWSQLADEHGFMLLYPEQQRANNPNSCFNWFTPEDTVRDSGEALSIRQMIATVIARHDIDPGRVFVTGLSAGGAMTSVMLATYPDVFASGAIIAGLPYGSASGVVQALDRMRGHGAVDAEMLGDLVRRASPHRGPWPTVSIWHGGADATVHSSNREAILAQWRAVHRVAAAPAQVDTVDGIPRRRWQDGDGRVVIEEFSIAGMGHGTPLATGTADDYGAVGAFMLDAGISSTCHIAAFWGLTDDVATVEALSVSARTVEVDQSAAKSAPKPAPKPASMPLSVGQVIDDALRAAGLMR